MASQGRKDLAHLCREVKTPSLLSSVDRIANRARDESWPYEEFLAACLASRVASDSRRRGARQGGAISPDKDASRTSISPISLGAKGHRLASRRPRLRRARDNVIFPPGTGKRHFAVALGIRACQTGHPVAFPTAAQWVDRLHAGAYRREVTRGAGPPRTHPSVDHRRGWLDPVRGRAPATCSSSSCRPGPSGRA